MKFKLVPIISIKTKKYKGIIHDLTVKDDQSYNIEGIIVHNSACLTRKKAGVGRPQLSTIIDCGAIAKEMGAYIISDGGCTSPGDMAKALSVADFCMIGSYFAGHEECDGRIINKYEISYYDMYHGASDNPYEYYHKPVYVKKQYKEFWGMSSQKAMDKHYNGKGHEYRTSEGRELLIKYNGEVQLTINDILGSLRSTCTYTNSKTIADLHLNVAFYRVNNQLNNMFNDPS